MSRLDEIDLVNYSRGEEWLNSISHMVGGAFAVIATILCVARSIVLSRTDYLILSIVYGVTMIAVYSCSAVYHALRNNRGKRAMRIVDHAMIYPMIAGTITPFAVVIVVPLNAFLGWGLFIAIWLTVAVGMSITFALFNKTKVLQMVLYLALGWSVLVTFVVLWKNFDHNAIFLMLAGGIAYTLGAIIYGIGAKKKYFHAIFHFFVILGSVCHFFGLYLYVFV